MGATPKKNVEYGVRFQKQPSMGGQKFFPNRTKIFSKRNIKSNMFGYRRISCKIPPWKCFRRKFDFHFSKNRGGSLVGGTKKKFSLRGKTWLKMLFRSPKIFEFFRDFFRFFLTKKFFFVHFFQKT